MGAIKVFFDSPVEFRLKSVGQFLSKTYIVQVN